MRRDLFYENWRNFLLKEETTLQNLPDEVLYLIFSKEITAMLHDRTLNEVESLETKAKRIAKKYGLPIALAMGLLTGTVGHEVVKAFQDASADTSAEIVDDTPSGYWNNYDLPPGYDDLSNKEAMDTAWKQYEGRSWQQAPVDGSYPLIRNGQVMNVPFAYLPASEISDDDVLPMALITAGQYREALVNQLESGNPKEVVYLKKMLYGNTGKWASGEGNADFRFHNDTNPQLPPEWSIAHDVYASAVEDRANNLIEYINENPEQRPEIAEMLGLQGEEQLEDYFNHLFYGIQR